MDSIWTTRIQLPHFGQLEGDADTDVLIVGGGLTGILCAHLLHKKGVRYMLVEGGRICSGITGNTTAKITFQHGAAYHKLVKQAGPEMAMLYLEANKDALNQYFEICGNMDCDFEEKMAYVYSMDNRKILEDEVQALSQIGFHADLSEESELPFPIAGAIGFAHQAQFHPLKFISQIAKNLHIYENSFVRGLSEGKAVLDRGSIRFQKVIFATHFPIENKHGLYFIKMFQYRSYVLALEHAPVVRGMYVDEAEGGMSFRGYGDFLLVGGGGHRTGKQGGGWQSLREFARKYYPSSAEITCWAAQDCMTLDGIPYIGQYSKAMPGCFVATGYNKWGMTSSMAAARVLADLVMGKANPYEELFSPSRRMLKAQALRNGCAAAANFLVPTRRRCPHLGCALRWNPAEHSWDCACHGSRFAADGTLLDNPANGDIQKHWTEEGSCE